MLFPECFLSSYRTFRLSIQDKFFDRHKNVSVKPEQDYGEGAYSGKGTVRGICLLPRDEVLEEEHGWLDADNFGWLIGEL